MDDKRDSGRTRESVMSPGRPRFRLRREGGKEGLGSRRPPRGSLEQPSPEPGGAPLEPRSLMGCLAAEALPAVKPRSQESPSAHEHPGLPTQRRRQRKLIQLRHGPGLAQASWDQGFELHHPRDSPGHWRRLSAQGQLKGKPRTEGPAVEQSEGRTLAVSA